MVAGPRDAGFRARSASEVVVNPGTTTATFIRVKGMATLEPTARLPETRSVVVVVP